MTQSPKKKGAKPETGGLMITSKTVVSAIAEQIELNGLEKAMKTFDEMTKCFAVVDGWPEAVRAVNRLFKKEKKKMKKEDTPARIMPTNQNITINGDNTHFTENPTNSIMT